MITYTEDLKGRSVLMRQAEGAEHVDWCDRRVMEGVIVGCDYITGFIRVQLAEKIGWFVDPKDLALGWQKVRESTSASHNS